MKIDDALKQADEHFRARRFAELQKTCQKILDTQPTNPDALSLMSIAARELGRMDDAVLWASRAAAAHPHVAVFHANLGQFLRLRGDFDQSLAEFRRAIELDPNEPTFHNSLGTVYGDLRKHEEAAAEYRRAFELRPTYADALNNFGGTLRELDRLDEAARYIIRALDVQQSLPNAWYNLAIVFADLGKFTEATQMWSRAITINPNDAHAHWNLGVLQLLQGDFAHGWQEYDWRPRLLKFSQPQWTGEDIASKTILLHAEQGIGDAIQFVRYAPLVAAKGARVKLMVHPELIRLFASTPGVEEVIPLGSPSAVFDVHCSLLSLPRIFQSTSANIPSQIPYLNPPEDLTQKASDQLGPANGKPRIGLVWAGRPEHRNDSRRSLRFEQLAPILTVPGIQFYSLQKGPAALREYDPAIIELAPELHDFTDTAAYIKNLDLVIAVDTSVAHLAGALGKNVWVFLPTNPDWRWMLDRSDSPWYPTMRLFRQRQRGDWTAPINDAARELAGLSSKPSPG
jgi:Tfp pilus assembly protein PilF/ADP-heptose:LPS heptosyltransferase